MYDKMCLMNNGEYITFPRYDTESIIEYIRKNISDDLGDVLEEAIDGEKERLMDLENSFVAIKKRTKSESIIQICNDAINTIHEG